MAKVAAGFIIFRRIAGVIEFLLLQATKGEHHWTPPKGHKHREETDLEAAYRETNEETGLTNSDFKLYENAKFTSNYEVKGKPKTVHYWLAELTNNNATVRLSHEHLDFKWLPLQEACNLAKYKELVDLLIKSESTINEISG